MRQGAYADALPYIEASIRIQKETNFIVNLIENYEHAAQIHEALNQVEEAVARGRIR